VIVTGCTTSGCVRATIVDAFSYGFRVLVPEECCGDPDEGQHRSNLQDVGRRYADVMPVAEVEATSAGCPPPPDLRSRPCRAAVPGSSRRRHR